MRITAVLIGDSHGVIITTTKKRIFCDFDLAALVINEGHNFGIISPQLEIKETWKGK